MGVIKLSPKAMNDKHFSLTSQLPDTCKRGENDRKFSIHLEAGCRDMLVGIVLSNFKSPFACR